MTNTHVGCKCQSCSRYYRADLLVDDVIWEQIKPEGKAEGAGLLCPTCMLERIVDYRLWSAGYAVDIKHTPRQGMVDGGIKVTLDEQREYLAIRKVSDLESTDTILHVDVSGNVGEKNALAKLHLLNGTRDGNTPPFFKPYIKGLTELADDQWCVVKVMIGD